MEKDTDREIEQLTALVLSSESMGRNVIDSIDDIRLLELLHIHLLRRVPDYEISHRNKMLWATEQRIKQLEKPEAPPSREEYKEIIYQYLQDVLNEEYLNEMVDEHAIYEDEYGNDIVAGYYLLHFEFGCYKNLRDYLDCLIRMQYYDTARGIVSWFYAANRLLPAFSWSEFNENEEEYRRNRRKQYFELVRDNLPFNLEGIEDTPNCTKEEILQELWSILPKEEIKQPTNPDLPF